MTNSRPSCRMKICQPRVQAIFSPDFYDSIQRHLAPWCLLVSYNLIRSFTWDQCRSKLSDKDRPFSYLHFVLPNPFFLQDTMDTFLLRATDEDLENARFLSYPKQVLFLIASFIALISLCHFFSMFYHFIIRKRIHEWKRRTTVSLTRLPAAVADSFRALAFRWTVPVGSSHELNFVEVGLTFAYMAVLYTWAFVNSMLHLFP